MGGFLLYKDGQPFQVVSPEVFTDLLDACCIEFPSVSAVEIRDKSMGHPQFAALAFLQTLWFVVQCIARRIQGFAITQLEMVTLSLVAMNGLLLIFWWNKPLDPLAFIRIDLIRTPPPSSPEPRDGDARAAIKLDFSREQSLGRRVKTIFKTEALFLAQNRRNPFLRALDFWLWAPLKLVERMLTDYGALFLRLDKHVIPEGSTEVNIFYAPDTTQNLGGFLFIFENVLGCLFAASHVSMWHSHFPTYRDMMVWRTASVFTVVLPIVFIAGLILFVAFYIVLQLLTIHLAGQALQALRIIGTTVVFLGFMAILFARMALIIEAFVCLMSLDGTTIQNVSWTEYIPHFS